MGRVCVCVCVCVTVDWIRCLLVVVVSLTEVSAPNKDITQQQREMRRIDAMRWMQRMLE
jgi:hypothetical protein